MALKTQHKIKNGRAVAFFPGQKDIGLKLYGHWLITEDPLSWRNMVDDTIDASEIQETATCYKWNPIKK